MLRNSISVDMKVSVPQLKQKYTGCFPWNFAKFSISVDMKVLDKSSFSKNHHIVEPFNWYYFNKKELVDFTIKILVVQTFDYY